MNKEWITTLLAPTLLALVGSASALPKPCPPKALSSVDARLLGESQASIDELLRVAAVLREQGSIQHAVVLDERAEGLLTAVGARYVQYLRTGAYCACLKNHKLAHPAPACAATPSKMR